MNSIAQRSSSLRKGMDELEENIRAELEVQLEIQALLDHQLDALIKGKTDDIPRILAEAEAHLKQSGALEETRADILKGLAAYAGVAMHEVRLENLDRLFGEESAGSQKLAEELRKTALRIRENNRVVQLLIRHSMMFIDDLIRVVTGQDADPRVSTYSRKGKLQQTQVDCLEAEG